MDSREPDAQTVEYGQYTLQIWVSQCVRSRKYSADVDIASPTLGWQRAAVPKGRAFVSREECVRETANAAIAMIDNGWVGSHR